MADLEGGRGLDRLAARALVAAEAHVEADTHAGGRARLLETARRVTSGTRARDAAAPRANRWRTAMALAALLGVAIVLFIRYREAPLSYEVRGSVSASTGYISARDEAPADVRFSDGSTVVARPGTRLRIEQATSNGARVLVERGGATASVRHRSRSSWAFVAGPFEVRVTGTKLTIAWDAETERIDVTLHEGSVEIETPIGPSRYSVTAGHSFHASVRDGTIKLDDERTSRGPATGEPSRVETTGPAGDSAALGRAAPARDTEAPDIAPKATDTPRSPEESWAKRVRLGEFADVVAAARARGVGDCLARCSSSDLRALADAARYTGATELATEALHALRSRFKGSRDGSAAAFLLGRTAESTGDLAGADRWYAAYLSESPSGALAADALAGRMLAAERLGALPRAREFAREYVNRYPDGAAVRAARKLAGLD